jgi:hypothetical protein
MKAQAKVIVALALFGFVCFLVDAVTTTWGLSHGLVESNLLSLALFRMYGQFPAYVILAFPWLLMTSFTVFLYYSFNSKVTEISCRQRNYLLWGVVGVMVCTSFFAYYHLEAGLQNLSLELSRGIL